MRPVNEKEHYLGDGLYVSIQDGFVILRAPRADSADGEHWVGLDAVVLDNFLTWLAEIRKQLLHPI